MGDHDPLGPARRARGVNHVGGVGGRGAPHRATVGGGLLGRNRLDSELGQLSIRPGQQDPGHGILQDARETLGRRRGLQRQVRGARLQGSQHADDHLHAAIQADGHPRFQTYAPPPANARPGARSAPGTRRSSSAARRRPSPGPRASPLPRPQSDRGPHTVSCPGRSWSIGFHSGTSWWCSGSGKNRQLAKRAIQPLDGSGQQRPEVARHAGDRGGQEEVGRLKSQRNASSPLGRRGHRELQVEPAPRPTGRGYRDDCQPWQLWQGPAMAGLRGGT